MAESTADKGRKSSVTCGILVQMDCGVAPLSEDSSNRLISLKKSMTEQELMPLQRDGPASVSHAERNSNEWAREPWHFRGDNAVFNALRRHSRSHHSTATTSESANVFPEDPL